MEKKLGFGTKIQAADGLICPMCGRVCEGYQTASISELKGYLAENHARWSRFSKTSELTGLMTDSVMIDSKNRLFCEYSKRREKSGFEPLVYAFEEVEGYRFELVGGKVVTKTKGGLGRAVVGGVLMGGVGAIVGATTAKQETKTVGGTNFLKVMLCTHSGRREAVFANPPGCTEFLDRCIDESDSLPERRLQVAGTAEELLKWKGLADQGVITAEEFEAKKHQLLGI